MSTEKGVTAAPPPPLKDTITLPEPTEIDIPRYVIGRKVADITASDLRAFAVSLRIASLNYDSLDDMSKIELNLSVSTYDSILGRVKNRSGNLEGDERKLLKECFKFCENVEVDPLTDGPFIKFRERLQRYLEDADHGN